MISKSYFLYKVDGNWGDWTAYTECSATCGYTATKTRTRECDNPEPRDGGRECEGDDTETTNCDLPDCPGKKYMQHQTLSN